MLEGISLMYPVRGILTQKFGENPQIYSRWGYPGHNGIDLAADLGTVVKASEGGTVEKIGFEFDGYGNYVKLKHNSPIRGIYYTLYAHLSSVATSNGSTVSKGQVIGYIGSTGFSSGPHLHFELQLPWSYNLAYKTRVDPLPYMEGMSVSPLTTTTFVQEGTAVVKATRGLNLRTEPNTFGMPIGTAMFGTKFEWDGETVKSTDGEEWLRLTVYASKTWLDSKEPLIPVRRTRRR